MRRSKKQTNSNNLRPLLLLGVFVISLFAISFLYKLSGLIKESKFDGENRFTVSVSQKSENGKAVENLSFFSIDPQTDSISILSFKKIPSISSVDEESIGIPADGYIVSNHKIDGNNAPNFFTQFFFSGHVSTNLTIIDIVRLYILSSSVMGNSIKSVDVDWPLDDLKKNLTEGLFLDQKIIKENLSIQIMNATGESGVASLFARSIGFLGGNVVSVTTKDSEKNTSEILYFGKRQYTHGKLHNLFRFELIEMKKEGIADIIIVVGKDYKKSLR